jgi:hypothetical protein
VIPLIEDARVFAGMAALEGSRLEESGAPEDAWDWYCAMVRSSRLIGRHGSLVQRLFGAKIHDLAVRCILRWASDPRVGAAPLRRALDDTLAADALTPPVSVSLKCTYLLCLNTGGRAVPPRAWSGPSDGRCTLGTCPQGSARGHRGG